MDMKNPGPTACFYYHSTNWNTTNVRFCQTTYAPKPYLLIAPYEANQFSILFGCFGHFGSFGFGSFGSFRSFGWFGHHHIFGFFGWFCIFFFLWVNCHRCNTKPIFVKITLCQGPNGRFGQMSERREVSIAEPRDILRDMDLNLGALRYGLWKDVFLPVDALHWVRVCIFVVWIFIENVSGNIGRFWTFTLVQHLFHLCQTFCSLDVIFVDSVQDRHTHKSTTNRMTWLRKINQNKVLRHYESLRYSWVRNSALSTHLSFELRNAQSVAKMSHNWSK